MGNNELNKQLHGITNQQVQETLQLFIKLDLERVPTKNKEEIYETDDTLGFPVQRIFNFSQLQMHK